MPLPVLCAALRCTATASHTRACAHAPPPRRATLLDAPAPRCPLPRPATAWATATPPAARWATRTGGPPSVSNCPRRDDAELRSRRMHVARDHSSFLSLPSVLVVTFSPVRPLSSCLIVVALLHSSSDRAGGRFDSSAPSARLAAGGRRPWACPRRAASLRPPARHLHPVATRIEPAVAAARRRKCKPASRRAPPTRSTLFRHMDNPRAHQD